MTSRFAEEAISLRVGRKRYLPVSINPVRALKILSATNRKA